MGDVEKAERYGEMAGELPEVRDSLWKKALEILKDR
jgi:hypothetical protein